MDSTSLVVRRISEVDGDKMQKELTEDEIVEILTRLPVKSLMRFKCVSKFWYNLISSPNFIAMHRTHNHHKNEVTLSLFSCGCNLTKSTTYLNFRFGDVTDTVEMTFRLIMGRVEIVGCFNGVACLTLSQRPQKYALWNPATRQVREIGDSPMDGPDLTNSSDLASSRNGGWYGSGFCFDPLTNAFKVAQIKLTVTAGRETRAQVNVFSTATNSWTEKNIVVPYGILGSGFNIIRGATFVNGYMHWHIAIFHPGPELDDMYILSYDMIDDVFKRIEMPSRPVVVGYHLAAYKGSLALFVHRRTGSDRSGIEVDVWVMNDCGGSNQSWSKLLTCRPPIQVERALGFFRKDGNDLIVLVNEERAPLSSLYLYDPENGETKNFSLRRPVSETFLYSESLAPLN